MYTATFRLFIIVVMSTFLFACTSEPKATYSTPCDLCDKHDFQDLSFGIQDYIHHDKEPARATALFLAQTDSVKSALKGGYKMIECGCTGDVLTYRIWCAGDETYEIYMIEEEENKFAPYGLRPASFDHP